MYGTHTNICFLMKPLDIEINSCNAHLERVEVAASAGAAIGDDVSLLVDVESMLLVGLQSGDLDVHVHWGAFSRLCEGDRSLDQEARLVDGVGHQGDSLTLQN